MYRDLLTGPLILSLPLSQTHSDLRSAESIHGVRPYVSLRDLHFTLLYVVVSQQCDKHLYMTSCPNARNHNTCIHLPQNRVYGAKDGILHY